jgi:hypothetical protein
MQQPKEGEFPDSHDDIDVDNSMVEVESKKDSWVPEVEAALVNDTKVQLLIAPPPRSPVSVLARSSSSDDDDNNDDDNDDDSSVPPLVPRDTMLYDSVDEEVPDDVSEDLPPAIIEQDGNNGPYNVEAFSVTRLCCTLWHS